MDGRRAPILHFPNGIPPRKRLGLEGSLLAFADESGQQLRFVILLDIEQLARDSICQEVTALGVEAIDHALFPDDEVRIAIGSVAF